MACISSALIVGGGIAGLATAIALSKAGVQCDVVELAAAPLGASLALSGRAAETLVDLGIYDECYDTGTPFEPGSTAATLSDSEGRQLSAGPQRPTWPGAKTAIGVYRPVFLEILHRAAEEAGARVRRGLTTLTVDDNGKEVSVTMTDGTQGTYDLVVSADGISSKTRQAIFPDAPKPAYSGQMSIRWMSSGPPITGEGWFVSPVGRLGFYHLPNDLMYAPAVITAPEGTWLEGEELYRVFSRLLDSFTAPPVLELKQRLAPDSNLVCRPFEWILQPRPWNKGRVLLIGDAAHATTAHMGMGGGMALEDAVVLGQSISGANTLDDAINEFMDRRYERVRTVVETSVALSRLEQAKAPPSESMALMGAAFQMLAQPY